MHACFARQLAHRLNLSICIHRDFLIWLRAGKGIAPDQPVSAARYVVASGPGPI